MHNIQHQIFTRGSVLAVLADDKANDFWLCWTLNHIKTGTKVININWLEKTGTRDGGCIYEKSSVVGVLIL